VVADVTAAELMASNRAPAVRCLGDLDPLEPVGTQTTEHGAAAHRRVSRWPEPGWVAACGARLCEFGYSLADLEVRCCPLCPDCWS
jgi:hypothetical protein